MDNRRINYKGIERNIERQISIDKGYRMYTFQRGIKKRTRGRKRVQRTTFNFWSRFLNCNQPKRKKVLCPIRDCNLEEWLCPWRFLRWNQPVDVVQPTAAPSSRRYGGETFSWIGRRWSNGHVNANCKLRTERSAHSCRCDSIVVAVSAYNSISSPDGEATCAPSSGEFTFVPFSYTQSRRFIPFVAHDR